MWDRCPLWYLERSPHRTAAGAFLRLLFSTTEGASSPPRWTPAGRELALSLQRFSQWLINVFDKDHDDGG